MKNKQVVILGLIALGLLAFAYFDVAKKPGTTENEKNAKKLLILKTKEVEQFTVKNEKGSFELICKDKEWAIQKPIDFPAETPRVNFALEDLFEAQKLNTVMASNEANFQESLNKFGLINPRTHLEFKTKEGLYTIDFGRTTALPGGVYVRVQSRGKDQIIVTQQSAEKIFQEGMSYWRDHKVFRFELGKATGLVSKTDLQEAELRKNNKKWELIKPLVAKLDNYEIQSLLGELNAVTVDQFIAEKDASLTSYGLLTPVQTITVMCDKQEQKLQIGSPVPDKPDFVYAYSSTHPVVVTLPKSRVDLWQNILQRVRDKRIVSYRTPDEITGIHFKHHGVDYQLRRQNEEQWKMDGQTRLGSARKIQSFLIAFETAKVSEFQENLTIDPAKAVTSITLDKKANASAKNSSSETVVLGTPIKDQIPVIAETQGVRGLLPKGLFDAFPTNPLDWLETRLWEEKAPPIQAIEWEVNGQTTKVESQGEKWSSAQGAIDYSILSFQIQALNTLSAVKWTGPVNKKDFAKPSLKIVIHRENITDTLEFGAEQPDHRILAHLNDEPYAFLIDDKDFQALRFKPIKGLPASETKQP